MYKARPHGFKKRSFPKTNVFDTQYYANTKFLLKIVGLWPFQSVTRRWISMIMYYLLTFSFSIPMVKKLKY